MISAFEPIAKKGLVIREPATALTGLKVMAACGDCLAPVIRAGDVLYIDLSQQPTDGDYAYFRWPQAIVDDWNASERKIAWEAEHGPATSFDTAIKVLELMKLAPTLPAEKWLIANDGMRQATDEFKLLGRVVAVERGGKRLC